MDAKLAKTRELGERTNIRVDRVEKIADAWD
jgi:hypothetical protein